MEINFFNEKTPSDKTEKTVVDIFRAAAQIMLNYRMLVLKEDVKRTDTRHIVITLEK